MSNDTSRQSPTAESFPDAPAAPSHRPLLTARTLPLLIGGCALLLLGWQWYDSNSRIGELQHELAKRLAVADVGNRESRGLVEASREALRELQGKVAVLESRLAESQNQQIALEALYQELSRNRDESALAEVEQILMLANQQLQLSGNVKAALIALQAADTRLQRIDRPQLNALRKVINKDIERLKLTPYVDVVGASVRLDNLIASIDSLPLAMEARPPAGKPALRPARDGEGAWARLAREAWQDLRQLVRIQNIDSPDIPLLAPEQSFFLRENLKLRLMGARMALLARDETSYKADLEAARAWVARYYDTRDKPIAHALTTLRQLAESPVSIQMPDISAGLDAVRNYKLVREKGR